MKNLTFKTKVISISIFSFLFTSLANAAAVSLEMPDINTVATGIGTLIAALVGIAAAILAYKMVRSAMRSA